MLKCYKVIVLCVYSFALCGMEDKECQLYFCPTRKEYYKQIFNNPNKSTKCCFCDPELLKTNYIIDEDKQSGVRVIANKNPYPDFDQAKHLLVMPIAHKELPSDFSFDELKKKAGVLQLLSDNLYTKTYSQEIFHSWGKMAGQTVPHWHTHCINDTMPPLSMPERMKYVKNLSINTGEEAFEEVKKLELLKPNSSVFNDLKCDCDMECACCVTGLPDTDDQENYVIARFTYNYICLAHYARYPGEVAVVPYSHVATINRLTHEEFAENMALAMALLPRMKEYAHTHIRDCDGGNIYTKSFGAKAKEKRQRKHHVYTSVMPRTTITLIPSAMDGSACKLDYNPDHLFAYLQEKIDEIKQLIQG